MKGQSQQPPGPASGIGKPGMGYGMPGEMPPTNPMELQRGAAGYSPIGRQYQTQPMPAPITGQTQPMPVNNNYQTQPMQAPIRAQNAAQWNQPAMLASLLRRGQ